MHKSLSQKWNQNPRWDGSFSWLNTSFLIATPLLSIFAAIFLIYSKNFSWFDFNIFFGMSLATGLSITAGYHRLFSHQSYKSSKLMELFYLLFGAAALQNSALKWSSDHRYHHRFVDKEGDPYSIKNGFLYAHMGWIFYNDPQDRGYDNAKDLQKNKLIQWQHRYFLIIALAIGFILPTIIGACFGRALEAFLWGGLFRTVFVHHGTFLINSAAHVFGKKTYSDKNSARDCWWLAFFTNGEGYHNFHHAFANDYRNGVKWYHWDPSKWLIYTLQFFGMSSDLKRTPDWLLLKVQAEKKYQELQKNLANKPTAFAESMDKKILELRNQLENQLQVLAHLRQEYQTWKEQPSKKTIAPRTSDIYKQKRQVKQSWNHYCVAIQNGSRGRLPA